MRKIKLAFFGSPDFAAGFLEKILSDKGLPVEVALVVTQPDSRVSRKQILTPTPVKIIAEKYFCFPAKNFGIELKNIDLALVYAYGDLISKEFLNLPKYGFWNIHPSLLPKYRGPSPTASPLINGDDTTGVTIIKMDVEIDHGPIIAQQSLTIKKTVRRPDLEKKLTDLAFEMFKKTIVPLTGLRVNGLKTTEQNHKIATYTKKLSKQDGFVEISNLKLQISNSPEKLYNLFRGLYPWPGIWTLIKPIQPGRLNEAKRLKITDIKLVDGKLIIKKVQLEGKKEVDFETFNYSYKIF